MPSEKTDNPRVWALVPAAGVGSRMQATQPKQYLSILGFPVIHHTLTRLCANRHVHGVVVGINATDRCWQNLNFSNPKLMGVYPGGQERFHTVLNGLDFLLQQPGVSADDWVLVHDAARPCLIQQDLENVIGTAQNNGIGAVLGKKVIDTLKSVNDKQRVQTTIDREKLWRAFTPQVFRLQDLRSAIVQSMSENLALTDDAMAMESVGQPGEMVEGHWANIKITTDADLELMNMALGAFN